MKLSFLFFVALAAWGQTFEAVSIKPAPPPDGHGMRVSSSGGPGTNDPGLYRCENCTVSSLVGTAYGVSYYQISGPATIDEVRFHITARIPEGATKEEFHAMMRDLLADRFRMTMHREQKSSQLYELVVAKNGPKLKESNPAPAEAAAATQGGKLKTDANGFPVLQGTTVSMAIMKDRAAANWIGFSMEKLAAQLSAQLGKPVHDATGLTGKYDIALTWASGAPSSAEAEVFPDLEGAIQEQLGLKLESRKGTIETIVVDHVEKMPTEN